MRKLLILIAILPLIACMPKYASDGKDMVTMTGYAVTETTYGPDGKTITGKRTMVPVKSEWAKMMDTLGKEIAELVGLSNPIIPGVLR
jgi:hypothetical protein